MTLSAVNWGDVPTWLAVGAAAVAGAFAWRAYQLERGRDKTAADDRRHRADLDERAQAEWVAAWADSEESGNRSLFLGRKTWGATVYNGSGVPIWEVQVDFSYEGEFRGGVRTEVVAPGHTFISWPEDLRRPSSEDTNGNPVYTEALNGFDVSLGFTDASGRRWQRGLDRLLVRVPEAEEGRPATDGGDSDGTTSRT